MRSLKVKFNDLIHEKTKKQTKKHIYTQYENIYITRDLLVRRWLGDRSQSEPASGERQRELSDLIKCLTRLSVHQLLNHQLGVVETAGQLLAAAKLLQC